MTADQIEVRYDVCEFDDHNVLVIRAASQATQYDIVIVRIVYYQFAHNEFVISLVNLDGCVWNLPYLAGWHPGYLKGHHGSMNSVTAATVAQILTDVAGKFDDDKSA